MVADFFGSVDSVDEFLQSALDDFHDAGCLDEVFQGFGWWPAPAPLRPAQPAPASPLQPAQCPFEWHTLNTKELKWLITTLFDVPKK